jgi:hypothetical protein
MRHGRPHDYKSSDQAVPLHSRFLLFIRESSRAYSATGRSWGQVEQNRAGHGARTRQLSAACGKCRTILRFTP